MSRKKKTVEDVDGTPVEVEDAPGTQELESTDADGTPRVDVEPLPVAGKSVRWTKKGEEQGAFSEHGLHVEGEVVATEFADKLIELGFAEAVT